MDFMKKKIIAIALCVAVAISAFSFGSVVNAVSTDKSETSASKIKSASDFSWDNASVYFLLTDRFYNGNTSNDHAYNRGLTKSGGKASGKDWAKFHGGDFAGITKKINEGYFDNLGVTALWISAPYEQMHGYCMGGQGHSNSFPHYSYHGYYALDFSQPDANFGTEAEFQTMVDTAHKHGIRIVLDIVMNHVGYNNMADMSEYGYGVLKSGWDNNYWNETYTSDTYHNYIDYNSDKSAWLKWYGTEWIRAGLPGYSKGGGELQGSLSYLPDVRTESGSTVDIPAVLKTKWTKEKTLSKKQQELNSYFSTYGGNKTVRNYLCAWLTSWVEKYGVDGFRCDTAKHVEIDSWVALKKAGLKALQTWRKNNPTKAGADWDEDFWMTGECFTHFVDKDHYFTSGAFDSMINFSFCSNDSFQANSGGVPGASSINGTYADYANKINKDDSFNVLSYISSHDTALCRQGDGNIYQGSAFQLLPGAIQIYYGDESNRPLVNTYQDHNLRSDMNFNVSGNNKKALDHWGKVGNFRKNHVSVGAGSHTNLSATSGTAFARTYDKGGVKDAVACVIAASANSNVTVTLNNTFADGSVVKNFYDGKTATVSGGKVTFNSGANGTILIEGNASGDEPATQPTTAKPTETQPATQKPTVAPPTSTGVPVGQLLYGDSDLNGSINIKDATVIQQHAALLTTLRGNALAVSDVDSSGTVNVKDATCVQKYIAKLTGFGKTGQAFGGSTPIVTQPATQPATQAPTATEPEPETQPDTEPETEANGTRVYFANDWKWETPNIYFWTDGSAGPNPWPGVAMQQDESGQWYYDIPSEFNKVIFNGNGQQTGDLDVPSSSGQTFKMDGGWS